MIPRKIHYIWFGGKAKPASVQRTIESWERILAGYEIIEWNESNFDISRNPWMEKMHRDGKFAFASDWARLAILQQEGGIYLDTDVEAKKAFDPFLGHEMFWGYEYDCYLATCVIGSRQGHPLLGRLLEEYERLDETVVNNTIVTRFFLRDFPGFRLDGRNQVMPDDVHIFDKGYFSVPVFSRDKNFCRHHGTNLWRENRKKGSWMKRGLRSLLGEVLYYRMVSWKVCRENEFYPAYKRDKKGRDFRGSV